MHGQERSTRRLVASIATLIAAALGMIACRDEPTSVSMAVPFNLDSAYLVAVQRPNPYEDPLLEIAKVLPSFGGYWMDRETGDVVVALTDLSAEADARRVVAERTSAQREHAVARGLRGGVVVRPARFTFVDLARWRDSVTVHLLGRVGGIHSVDLDELNNSVTVGVPSGLSREAMSEIAPAVANLGIPAAAIRVEASSKQLAGPTAPSLGLIPMLNQYGTTLSDSSRPVLGGTYVRGSGCTIAFIVKFDNVYYASTASHCTPVMASMANPGYMQQLSDAQYAACPSCGFVGNEVIDPPGFQIQSWYWGRWSDAALFSLQYANGAFGKVARTQGLTSITIDQNDPYFQLSAEETGGIANGWYVFKIGRVTGWTHGWVVKSCIHETLDNGFPLFCQFEANFGVEHGDSGSPVLAPYAGGYMAVGILSAKVTSDNWPWGPIVHGRFSGLRGIEIDLTGSSSSGRFFVR